MAEKKYLVEYTEWLDAELTRRYRTTQAKAGKSRGRNALSDVPSGGGVGVAEYNGYFKVIWDNEVDDDGKVTQRRVKVIDGSNPENGIAGDTDIGTVSSASVDIPSGAITLYLIATYAENKYTPYFSHERPTGTHGYYILANISNDKISQVWTSGAIYFGERYYI